MYSRAVPLMGDESEKDDKPLYDDTLDANNPDNYNKFDDFEDEIVVRA